MLFFDIIILSASLFASVFFLRRFGKEKNELKKENERLSSQLKDTATQLEKMKANQEGTIRLVQQAILNERTRIAHELHDDAIQRLIAIRFRLEKLTWYPLRDEVENEINLLRDELTDVVKETRLLIYNEVRTQFENDSFSKLLVALVAKFEPMVLPKVSLIQKYTEQEFSIPPAIKKDLLYIVQELVHNSLKHSAATALEIETNWSQDLTIQITDNGIGFLGSDKGGVGSRTIQFRAENIGASVKKLNKIGGAQVQIVLPHQAYF